MWYCLPDTLRFSGKANMKLSPWLSSQIRLLGSLSFLSSCIHSFNESPLSKPTRVPFRWDGSVKSVLYTFRPPCWRMGPPIEGSGRLWLQQQFIVCTCNCSSHGNDWVYIYIYINMNNRSMDAWFSCYGKERLSKTKGSHIDTSVCVHYLTLWRAYIRGWVEL